MKTVKEVSKLTGISVRTLHYYDEIGLLEPTACTEAGYRLYDDKALERLQQILFFREFDIPLKEIQNIVDNPAYDQKEILKRQKRMLKLKIDRLLRLMSNIDDILKGENKMDFEVFNKTELEELYETMISNMPEEMKEKIAGQYGGLEEYHRQYMERASSEQVQRNYQKLVEWYGDKESVLNAANHVPDSKILEAYQQRVNGIMKKLADKKDMDVTSFEVKQAIGEYGFVMKQLYQIKDERVLMLEMAASYREDDRLREALDKEYGDGTAEFFAAAVEAFYKEKQ